MALAGRLAVIAGGLGGIGSATGRILRSQGAKLAILYAPFEASRKQSLLDEGYGRFEKGEITTYEADITSPESITEAFTNLTKDVTSNTASQPLLPSILINTAGYVNLHPLEDTPPDDAMKHLTVNIIGPMLTSQAFAKMYFAAQDAAKAQGADEKALPPGRIVSISSQAAHVALDKHGAYCASKAGLMGLTQCMANEWGPRGITSNTVSPTVVWTVMGQKAWADDKVREAFQANIPTRRFASPDEVAEAITYLCQDSSGMVNGADIRVDGGFTIR